MTTHTKIHLPLPIVVGKVVLGGANSVCALSFDIPTVGLYVCNCIIFYDVARNIGKKGEGRRKTASDTTVSISLGLKIGRVSPQN